jgi:hypothetical protein
VSALLDQVKQLWKAGKYGEMDELIAAEAEKEAQALADSAAASVVAPPEHENQSPALSFHAGQNYRVHFKNGCSGEYVGEVLANRFPFDPEQVASVERIA